MTNENRAYENFKQQVLKLPGIKDVESMPIYYLDITVVCASEPTKEIRREIYSLEQATLLKYPGASLHFRKIDVEEKL